MSLLWQKATGFVKMIRNWQSGIRRDAPYFGTAGAIGWHSLEVRQQLRHYAGRPPLLDPVEVHLAGYEHPVWLRPRTSDYQVYRQVFVEREYANVDDAKEVRVILDCGANIGLASIYFLRRFPKAKIVAVEPDPENLAICRRNLAPYGDRVKILQGGVWSDRTRLAVIPSIFGEGNKWGIQVRPFQDGDPAGCAVEAFDIPSLLAQANSDRVDILKIDIERSELPVFECAPERWLPGVRNLVIELHGDDCSRAFFAALEPYEYKLSYRGDLTYCLNLQPAPRPVGQWSAQ